MAATNNSVNFWFNDGNIILNARNTHFRVHRGILGRHAQVFQDMSSIPQPHTEEEPLMEGCPIIPLDDDPKDWENLLNVVYDCNTSCFSKETWELPMLASVLRLGRKYAFDRLYDAALARIKQAVPTSLKTWDELWRNLSNPESDAEFMPPCDVVDLLNLVLELDIRFLLPRMYILCLDFLELEDVLFGTERDDGSIAKLSAASIETLILGKEKILFSNAFQAFPKARIPDEGCLSRDLCSNGVFSPYPNAARALQPWDDYMKRYCYCEVCRTYLEGYSYPIRREIWRGLPAFFGLEPLDGDMDA